VLVFACHPPGASVKPTEKASITGETRPIHGTTTNPSGESESRRESRAPPDETSKRFLPNRSRATSRKRPPFTQRLKGSPARNARRRPRGDQKQCPLKPSPAAARGVTCHNMTPAADGVERLPRFLDHSPRLFSRRLIRFRDYRRVGARCPLLGRANEDPAYARTPDLPQSASSATRATTAPMVWPSLQPFFSYCGKNGSASPFGSPWHVRHAFFVLMGSA